MEKSAGRRGRHRSRDCWRLRSCARAAPARGTTRIRGGRQDPRNRTTKVMSTKTRWSWKAYWKVNWKAHLNATMISRTERHEKASRPWRECNWGPERGGCDGKVAEERRKTEKSAQATRRSVRRDAGGGAMRNVADAA